MNRTQILASVFGLLLVFAGMLYYEGYWDSWKNYHGELKSDMLMDFTSRGMPEEMADEVSECTADAAVTILDMHDCRTPNNEASALYFAQACFMGSMQATMQFTMASAKCMRKARKGHNEHKGKRAI